MIYWVCHQVHHNLTSTYFSSLFCMTRCPPAYTLRPSPQPRDHTWRRSAQLGHGGSGSALLSPGMSYWPSPRPSSNFASSINPSFTRSPLTLWSPAEFLFEYNYHLALGFCFFSYCSPNYILTEPLFVPSLTQCLIHTWYSVNVYWMLDLPPNHLLLSNTEILIH